VHSGRVGEKRIETFGLEISSKARYEVSTAIMIHVVVFQFVIPCSDVVGYRRFGGPCCFHLRTQILWEV